MTQAEKGKLPKENLKISCNVLGTVAKEITGTKNARIVEDDILAKNHQADQKAPEDVGDPVREIWKYVLTQAGRTCGSNWPAPESVRLTTFAATGTQKK